MTRKEWYDVVAPAVFTKRNCAKTLVNKTMGQKISSDFLRGRVYELSLADLTEDDSFSHRKILLKCDDIQGRSCITNFYGMDLTTDRLRSLIRKWCTLVECHADVKTSDNYGLRVFLIGFTKRRPNHVKKNCFAQTSQIRHIRSRMTERLMQIQKLSLRDAVKQFTQDQATFGKDIERMANSIYPLRDVYVRKVKLTKAPKIDGAKLVELFHDGDVPRSTEETGTAAD